VGHSDPFSACGAAHRRHGEPDRHLAIGRTGDGVVDRMEAVRDRDARDVRDVHERPVRVEERDGRDGRAADGPGQRPGRGAGRRPARDHASGERFVRPVVSRRAVGGRTEITLSGPST